MTEIEVGEYVRTKRGYIAKFKQYLENTGTYIFDNIIQDIEGDKYKCISENELKKVMIKHSKDIIDLIKVGDYVNGKEVKQIGMFEGFPDYPKLIFVDEKHLIPGETAENKDIKSILTKEIYEQNCFKVVK